GLPVPVGADAGSVDQGGDAVHRGVVVLVPGDDQQAVVRHGPLRVPGEVAAQPVVGLADGAVVHVVLEVRDDEGERGQARVVGRELGPGAVDGGGEAGEVDPGVVASRVVARVAAGVAGAGHGFGVAGEGAARGQEFGAE